MNRLQPRRTARRVASLALTLGAAVGTLLAGDGDWSKIPGYVDGSSFSRLAAEENATTVEVNLHGALLRALVKIDPELARLAGGLESIHAVILDFGDTGRPSPAAIAKLRATVESTEQRLRKGGWERIAVVKEPQTVIKVLVLNDEEAIQGLVVMVVGEEEVVFANLAGVLDLAAIEQIGERFDVPGLGRLKRAGE